MRYTLNYLCDFALKSLLNDDLNRSCDETVSENDVSACFLPFSLFYIIKIPVDNLETNGFIELYCRYI